AAGGGVAGAGAQRGTKSPGCRRPPRPDAPGGAGAGSGPAHRTLGARYRGHGTGGAPDGGGGDWQIALSAGAHRARRRRRPGLAGMSGLALLSAYGPLPPDRAAGTRRAALRPRAVASAEAPQTSRAA